MPTAKVTFVHAVLVLATFVRIRNISAVSDPIFTTFWTQFLFGPKFYLPKLFLTKKFCGPKILWKQFLCTLKDLKFFWPKILWTWSFLRFLNITFFSLKIIFHSKIFVWFFGSKNIVWLKKFFGLTFLPNSVPVG